MKVEQIIALENKIKQSNWWQKANITVDSHYENNSGVMLSHHLIAVYKNIEHIFQQKNNLFYQQLFRLLEHFNISATIVEAELKIIALLHDLGKLEEDKNMVIAHPVTGKPAHKRHGLVSMMMAEEILKNNFDDDDECKNRILRTIELHDMSYGLFREFSVTGNIPIAERWQRIDSKISNKKGLGILYLLIFKLADTHGHLNIEDVVWFFYTVKENYYNTLQLNLPLPSEDDIV